MTKPAATPISSSKAPPTAWVSSLNAKRSAHDSEAASLSDAERATALTSMGYDVIQITFGQIKDKKSFDHIAELIHKKAGLSYTPKTKQERAAEVTLRQELLVNWVELFTAKPAS